MRSHWLYILFGAAMFAACGDDGSDFAVRPDGGKSVSSERLSSSSAGPTTLATRCKTQLHDDCEYGTLTDERDGRTYKTVKIGNQWWMAENLDFATEESACTEGSYVDVLGQGQYYTWADAIDSVALSAKGIACGDSILCNLTSLVRGICPEGWHLPSMDDFNTLIESAGEGFDLMTTTGWQYMGMASNDGTDALGFSAYPAGYTSSSCGSPLSLGYSVLFWSSWDESDTHAGGLILQMAMENANYIGTEKNKRNKVRCVKD